MDNEECRRFDRFIGAGCRFYDEMCKIPEMDGRDMADTCAFMLAALLRKAWTLDGEEGLNDLLTEFAATFTALIDAFIQDDSKVIKVSVNISEK
jgi:hypothetical protein